MIEICQKLIVKSVKHISIGFSHPDESKAGMDKTATHKALVHAERKQRQLKSGGEHLKAKPMPRAATKAPGKGKCLYINAAMNMYCFLPTIR